MAVVPPDPGARATWPPRGPPCRPRRTTRLGAAAPLLLGAWALVAGCSSRPWLADEHREEPYASWGRAAAGLAHEPARVRVRVPPSPAVSVALDVARSPRGADRPVLVLQPGLLSDGSTWRFLVGALAGQVDTIAVDPPGTGASGAPDPRRAGPEAYTPTWLAEHTLLALEAWEREGAGRRRYVLVGHSLGGTAVLRMLSDPGLGARHHELLARVEGAVLFAPADVAMERVNPQALEVLGLTDLVAGLGSLLGMLRTKVAEGVRDNATDPCRDALRDEAERIGAMFGRTEQRHAAQAMLERFGPRDAAGRRDLVAARALAEQERSIRLPLLVFWGREDATLPVEQSGPLMARLPTARLEVVPRAKHSLHQERAAEVARQILAFAPLASSAPAPTGPARGP